MIANDPVLLAVPDHSRSWPDVANGRKGAPAVTRSVPPFRADHVGSLLRPAPLMAARDDFAAGRIDAARLRAAEDEAIKAAVAMQRDVGLQDATDGEFRRATWHMDFINQIGGIGQAAGNMKVRFRNASGDIEWTPAAIHV